MPDEQIDRAVEAMAKADDYQISYERCRWMLKAALPIITKPLPGVVTLSGEEVGRVRALLEQIETLDYRYAATNGCALKATGLATEVLSILTRAQKEG